MDSSGLQDVQEGMQVFAVLESDGREILVDVYIVLLMGQLCPVAGLPEDFFFEFEFD